PDAVPTGATLYLIRALNPDGATMPHKKEGRSNANQVDLNRSFPVGWSADWNRDGCWDMLELNAGTHPASEPETIALMAFVLENPVIAVISYHSAAPGFYPAGEPTDPNSAALSTYLSKVTGYPYPAVVTGCYMTGSLVDWTLTTGAAGADVELSTHWDTEFNVNLNLVQALLRWEPEPEE
ncbi:MAG: M14 family metallopeptidase, partial [Anaerolineales bacterium]